MATQLEGARPALQRCGGMANRTAIPSADPVMAKTGTTSRCPCACVKGSSCSAAAFSLAPVERVYRDIRGLCIGAGTVEIQRNFIGTSVLKGATPASDGWKSRRA